MHVQLLVAIMIMIIVTQICREATRSFPSTMATPRFSCSFMHMIRTQTHVHAHVMYSHDHDHQSRGAEFMEFETNVCEFIELEENGIGTCQMRVAVQSAQPRQPVRT